MSNARKALVLLGFVLLPSVSSSLAAQTLRRQAPVRLMAIPRLEKADSLATVGVLPNAPAASKVVESFRDLARFVRDSGAVLVPILESLAQAPDVFSASANVMAKRAVLVAVALDPAALRRYLEAAKATPADRLQIEAEAVAIRAAMTSLRQQKVVSLYADGTIRNALDGTKSDGAASATGSIGVAVGFAGGWSISTSIAVASTVDTVGSEIGAAVLVPAAGRSKLSTFVTEVRSPVFFAGMGARAYAHGANSLWRADTAAVPDSAPPLVAAASVVGLGLGVYRDFCTCRLLSTPIRLTGYAGVTRRAIQGDVAQDTTRIKAFLGTSKRRFWGPEFGLSMEVGLVQAAVQWYALGKGNGLPVSGLTGGRLVIGVSVGGDVFAGPASER